MLEAVKRSIALLLVSGLFGQQGDLRLKSELVLVPVVVEREDGVRIEGLNRDDFMLYDEGTRRPIEYFDSEELPLRVALVFVSPNAAREESAERMRKLRGNEKLPPGIPTREERVERWNNIKEITLSVLDWLNPGDKVALFSTCGTLEHALTDDFTAVKDKIGELASTLIMCNGSFLLEWKELVSICHYLKESTEKFSRRVIMIIADNHVIEGKKEPIPLDDVVATILDSNVVICGIGVEDPVCRLIRQAAMTIAPPLIPLFLRWFKDLSYFSKFSGGMSVDGYRHPDEATSRMRTFLQGIRQSYVLGFRPRGRAKPGKVQQVKVELARQAQKKYPQVRLLYRRGYIVEAALNPDMEPKAP